MTEPETDTGADANGCPLCGEPNECGMAAGKDDCWCFHVTIGEDVLAQVPDAAKGKACICRRCAEGERSPVQIRGRANGDSSAG